MVQYCSDFSDNKDSKVSHRYKTKEVTDNLSRFIHVVEAGWRWECVEWWVGDEETPMNFYPF